MGALMPTCLRTLRCAILALVSLVLCACGTVRYYGQAVRGQGELVVQRRAVSAVIRDPATTPQFAARLRLALQARHFASLQLGLPDNRSYTRYVELHRTFVAWNVFATRPYSVDAVQQCFPIAGCVAYRGWFKESSARADAARLRAHGDDVWVGGVSAYSTLGWFADPILSSMLRLDADELIGTIFHELAHQLIYVKGDTTFNESFATFVQTRGLRQWRQSRGLPAPDPRLRTQEESFTRLVLDLRERLKALYASGVGAGALAAGKQREFGTFRTRYAQWRDRDWPDDHRYDAWVAAPLNNARLLPFGLYAQWTPAFALMFECAGSDWPRFHAAVRVLAREPRADRDQVLQALVRAVPQGVDVVGWRAALPSCRRAECGFAYTLNSHRADHTKPCIAVRRQKAMQ